MYSSISQIALALVFAGVAGACDSHSPPQETRSTLVASTRDSSGVTIVAIADFSREEFLELHPALQLDSLEPSMGKPLYQIASGILTRSGAIVAEKSTGTIRYFDAAGHITHSVGQKGSGPGDFTRLRKLMRYRADSLLAFDGQTRLISVLDSAGKFARSVMVQRPKPLIGAYEWIEPVGSLADGRAYYSATPINGKGIIARDVRYAMQVFSGTLDSADNKPFAIFPGRLNHEGPMMMEACEISFGGASTFSLSDSLFFGAQPDGEIRVYDRAGSLRTIVRIEDQRQIISAQQKSAERARLQSETSRNYEFLPEKYLSGRRKAITEMQFPDSFPLIESIHSAKTGEAVVELFTPPDSVAASARYLLIDAHQKPTRTFRLPPGVRVIDFNFNRLLALRVDGDGVESLEIYQLAQR